MLGYTAAAWIVIVWCGGLGVWEYIGRKHEWSPFCLANVALSLSGVVAWSCVYLLAGHEDPDDTKYYVLFGIFGSLAIGSLIFALICFVDSQYTLRPMLYFLFILSFASGIIAAVLLWVKWLSVLFVIALTFFAYFVYVYIIYKKNKRLNATYKGSIYAALAIIGVAAILVSALYSDTAMFLTSFGVLLGTIAGMLLYLYVEKVALAASVEWGWK